MKPEASLLNFARDAVVDEAAVIVALRERRLKYYLCDFPRAALLREPGVVALPHLGASTEEAAHLANYAGGLVVMKRGTATVSQQELLQAIEKAPPATRPH